MVPSWRVNLGKIAKRERLTTHIEALMAAEWLRLGGMRNAIHPGCQRTLLEAVTDGLAPAKVGSDSTALHIERNGLSRWWFSRKAGEGRSGRRLLRLSISLSARSFSFRAALRCPRHRGALPASGETKGPRRGGSLRWR